MKGLMINAGNAILGTSMEAFAPGMAEAQPFIQRSIDTVAEQMSQVWAETNGEDIRRTLRSIDRALGDAFFDNLRDFSQSISGKPTFLVLDDFDEMSEMAQAIILKNMSTDGFERLIVILTLQEGTAQANSLAEELGRGDLARNTVLLTLSAPTGVELLSQLQEDFGAAVSRELVDHLSNRSGGSNPVIIREIIQALLGWYGGRPYLVIDGQADERTLTFTSNVTLEDINSEFFSVGSKSSDELSDILGNIWGDAIRRLDDLDQFILAAIAFGGNEVSEDFIVAALQQDTGFTSTAVTEVAHWRERVRDLAARLSFLVSDAENIFRFDGAYTRFAILKVTERIWAPRRAVLLAAAVVDAFRLGHALQQSAAFGSTCAELVLSVADGNQPLCRMRVSGSSLHAFGESSLERVESLRSGLASIVISSLPDDRQTEADISERADKILSAAAEHFYVQSLSGRDRSAQDRLRFLASALRASGYPDFPHARARASVLQLRLALNRRPLTSGGLQNVIKLSEIERKAAREHLDEMKPEENWRLALLAIEMDILHAEAVLGAIKSGQAKSGTSNRDREEARQQVFRSLREAVERLSRDPGTEADRNGEKNRLLDRLLSGEIDKMAYLDLLSEVEKSESTTNFAWPKGAKAEVDFQLVRARERLVFLLEFHASPDDDRSQLEETRAELSRSLEDYVKMGPQPHLQARFAWATRKLGLILRDQACDTQGDLGTASPETINISERAVQFLSISYDQSKAPNVAMELLRAIEFHVGLVGDTRSLTRLRDRLLDLGRELVTAPLASRTIVGVAEIESRICARLGDGADVSPPSLWAGYVAGDTEALFVETAFTDFARIPSRNDRYWVLSRLFSEPELAETNVLERLLASGRDIGGLSIAAIVDTLDVFEQQRFEAVPDKTPLTDQASSELLRALDQIGPKIQTVAPPTRVALDMLRFRVLAQKAIVAISHSNDSASVFEANKSVETLARSIGDLAQALRDEKSAKKLIGYAKQIGDAFLARAASMEDRAFHFALRDAALAWYQLATTTLQTCPDLKISVSILRSHAGFHRDHGNFSEARLLNNACARLERYRKWGNDLGGTVYAATDAILTASAESQERGARLLLLAVLKAEIVDPQIIARMPAFEAERRQLRTRLAAVLWQSLRSRQPKQVSASMSLAPPIDAVRKFAEPSSAPDTGERPGRANSLVGDILSFWAAEPPPAPTPGTLVVARISAVLPNGIELLDLRGQRFRIDDNLLPSSYYQFLKYAVGRDGSDLAASLRKKKLAAMLPIIVLAGDGEAGLGDGVLPATARGLAYLGDLIGCLLPGLSRGLVVGGSNSVVALRLAQPDFEPFRVGGWTLHKQIAAELLCVKRLILAPAPYVPQAPNSMYDRHALLQQELADFARATWSALSLVSLRQDLSEATFEIAIDAPVSPQTERTTRSLLRKAFPDVHLIRFLGGALEEEAFSDITGDTATDTGQATGETTSPNAQSGAVL